MEASCRQIIRELGTPDIVNVVVVRGRKRNISFVVRVRVVGHTIAGMLLHFVTKFVVKHSSPWKNCSFYTFQSIKIFI